MTLKSTKTMEATICPATFFRLLYCILCYKYVAYKLVFKAEHSIVSHQVNCTFAFMAISRLKVTG